MGRLIACLPVLNEADYIWWVLKSLYPACDKIIVAEGSTQWMPEKRFNQMGLSVDDTGSIIKEFQEKQDPDDKVVHIKVGRVFEGSGSKYPWARNYVVDYIEPGDLHLMCDGDEIYDPNDLFEIKEFMEKHQEFRQVSFECLMFWLTLHQLLRVKDVTDIQPRITRWEEGMYFEEEHRLVFKNGVAVSFAAFKEGLCFNGLSKTAKNYHVGWVRENMKYVEKRCRGLLKCKVTDTSARLAYLKDFDRDDIIFESVTQGKMWTKEYGIGEYAEPYEGPWPEALKAHPWFHREEKDFNLNMQGALQCASSLL